MRALQASESTVFAGLGESHACCYLLAASNALTNGERLRPNARRSTKAHANIRPRDANRSRLQSASELSVSATRGRVPVAERGWRQSATLRC